jgi:CheY-like chemotaxis protein
MTESEQRPSGEAIVVADSEVIVRHAIADYLRHCGYSVFEAATSDEALIIVQQADLRIDAILCDVKIAGAMNGFELCRWIRENRPGTQAVLAAGVTAAAENAAELCENGPLLSRPYDPQSVVDYIKRLFASRDRHRAD